MREVHSKSMGKLLWEGGGLQTLRSTWKDFSGAVGCLMLMNYEGCFLYTSLKWFGLEPATSDTCYIFRNMVHLYFNN